MICHAIRVRWRTEEFNCMRIAHFLVERVFGCTGRRDARVQRSARLGQSCEALGISDWNWLSNPGRWIDTGAQPAVQSLSMATLDELCPSILKAVNDINPRWLFTVGTMD